MLSMIAVVPEPPLLLPELATGAAAETADLRAACVAAATRLAGAASRWVCVGADTGGRRTVPPDARGSFIGFGADVVVGLDTAGPHAAGSDTAGSDTAGSDTAGSDTAGPDTAGPDTPVDRGFPLPLLVAGWLAGQTGAAVRIRGELVAPDAPPDECAALGRALAGEDAADGWGLLVVGDGAATHSEKAPGYLDERAGPFDASVAAALRDADPAALAALDPDLATALLASGRAPWQVLAGAAAGRSWTGELLHSSMPFGVAYHVAVWTP